MPLIITFELPPDIEQRVRTELPDLESTARQALALELFRQQKLSRFELSQILGIDRFETFALLKRHNIFEGSLTHEDIEADIRTLTELFSKAPDAPRR